MAIIRSLDRPALAVKDDAQIPWAQWPGQSIAEPPHERIERAIAAVARLLVSGDPTTSWIGSCFIAGPRLAFAASFAVSTFIEGAGTNVTLKAGKALSLQFLDGRTKDVARVLFLHPYFRVALLELVDGDGLPDPLGVTSTSPENLGGKDVAVISCAAKDARQDPDDQERIFGPDPEAFFYVQPGKVLQVGSFIEGAAPGLLHDCSCVGGSGGGPLLDLASGHVLGLHTSGRQGTNNYAEPMWELARDPEVWKYDIGFRPAAKPTWLDLWTTPGVPQSPTPPAAPTTQRWTVNEPPPLDFTDPGVQTLLRTLFTNIDDVEVAMNFALDAGITPGTVREDGEPELVWRRILQQASRKGVLATLVRLVHDDPEYGGIKPVLGQVL